MRIKDLELILDGCALLEAYGNYYEYIGNVDGRLCFQNVNDDSYIKSTYERLLHGSESSCYRAVQ